MTTPAAASDASTAPYASYGAQGASYDDLTMYDGYAATGFASAGQDTGDFHSDPLFGSLPGEQTTGAYDATRWNSAGQPAAAEHEQSAEAFDQQATSTFEQVPFDQ